MRAPRPFRAALALLAAIAGATLPVGGCDSSSGVKLCGEIPAGGCPLGRGGSCDDAVCKGLYDCVEGKWTLGVDCAAHPGASSSSASGSSGSSGSGGACTPVSISHAGEALGCMPDLENPDCTAAVLDGACRESVCLTSCLDFFLCTKDGWALAASCDDQGNLTTPP